MMSDESFQETASGAMRGGRYGSVIGIPDFRALWVANMLSGLGEALSSVALPLLAYALTGSAQLASQVFVARLIPTILLAPISGVMVDRFDRRKLMIGADIIRAVLVAVIPFTTEAWQIAVLAFLVSINDAVARPASLASVPLVVPPSSLVVALSANQVGGSVIRIIGPALGAAIIGAAGPRPAFFLQSVCFIVGAIALLPLRLPAHDPSTRGESIGRDMLEGLETVRSNPVVRGTASVEALWQTITAALAVTLVVFIDKTMGYGERTGQFYGALMAVFSLGAAVGALAASRVERRIGRARLMAIGYFSPLLIIPFVLVPPDWSLFVLGFFFFFGDAWAVIAMQAYLAEAVPNRLRGRVYAAWSAAVTSGAAVAFLVIGWLTTQIGPAATLAAAGLLVGVGGPLLLYLTGALEAMRNHRPVTNDPVVTE
jgi:MFS family permease